jgi:hypothetical protein
VSRPSWRVGKALIALLASGLVFAIGAPGGGAVPQAPFELWVVFHENHTITVAFDDGTPVGTLGGTGTVIAPGSYTLHFDDAVGVEGPDFDLRGPGVSLQEDLFFGEAPSATHRVTFQPGSTYTWRNTEQPNTVFTFRTSAESSGGSGGTVSGGGSSSGGGGSTSTSKDPVGSKAVAFRGILSASVSTKGALTLRYLGKTVTTLKTGRYRVSFRDETSKAGFYLQRQGRAAVKISSKSFVGKGESLLELKAGKWFFYSPAGKKSSFTVVS